MDDEEEQAASLAAALDSLRHMSRDEMKTVLLDGSNDPEYIATVDNLFSRDDVSQEQLVEIFKETLFSNNAEASDAAPSTSTSKKKKQVYTSSEEEEEVVVRRPGKKRVLPSSDESVDSNETVNLAKVKKIKPKTKEETKPAEVPKKVVETISIDSSSDSEIDRRKYTKYKEKSSKEDVSKKPEAKSSKHEKASRKEHRVDKEPSRLKEESSRSRELEKDKRDESKSAARVERKLSSSDRKDKTSKEEKRKEEKRKAEKHRVEELKRDKEREKEREEKREQEREKEREEKRQKAREEKRLKEREERREREREEKREKEREEKREKEREEKREKEREEKREKERQKAREEKREREREEQREKEPEEKREKEREEKREKAREEKREREREEQREKERQKAREEKREREREEQREKERDERREKERKHSKEETCIRRDETKADEWDKSERMSKEERQQSDKYGGDKERFKSVSETDKDMRVKVDDQNLDTKLHAEVQRQVEVDSVVQEITEGHKQTDSEKNEISAVIDSVMFTGTAARSDENIDNQVGLASTGTGGSTDAKIEPAVICDTSANDMSAPVPGSANKPSDAIPSSSLLQQDGSLLTKKGSFEAAISTEIIKERALEAKDKTKNQEDSRKEVSFPPEFKVRVPQVPLTDPDFKKYKKKFRLRRLKIVLYDVQKQKRDMQEGDKVHRAEERKRKKDRHKLPERKEKYSERGTRILPFEKRPENADIYGRKREIVREKPKTETPTEKQKRFAELHKKEREKEDKKKIHLINTEFRIPKAGKKHKYNLVENIISSSTPLAPPVKVSKMHFDKRRMVTTTAKEDSWGLTPEEEAALKKLEKDAEKKKKSKKDTDLIILDDEMPDFGFQDQDDDNDLFPSTTRPAAADQEADDADSVGYPPTDTPPSPIKECEMNDLSMGVVRLLFTQTCIELADEHATHADVIMQKCGRWFRSVEHEPYYQACPSVPEQTEEEFYTLMEAMEEDEDDVSFIGNVSNPDGDDDLQDSEITSTALDPDQLDEYCGAALLNAKLRVKPGDSPDCFKNILEVRRGCNYDKVNFQAKCLLCEEPITDKRILGVHLRSSKHRTHLTETSLKLVEMSMKSKKSDSVSVPPDSKTNNKIDSSRSEKDKEKEAGKEKQSKIPESKPKETGKEIKEGAVRREDVKRHRSRSRSPRRHRNSRSRSRGRRSRSRGRRSRSRSRGRRSRSRSPQRRRHRSRSRSFSPRGRHHHMRSMSPGRRRMSHVEESVGRSDRRRSRSPKAGVSLAHRFKETDDLIFKEKLKLVANGKWTTQLEGRWKLKEEEEAQLKKIFVKKRKNLEEKPEEHELYNGEWSKFWERRYQELLEENKDPDDYDYTPEWKVHWKRFSEEILDKEFATRMEEIRTKFGLDLSTLRALNTASAPPPVATLNLGHGPIPPPGHPIFNPLVPPLGIPGVSVMPPMPMVPTVHVPMVGAPPLPVGPIPPTFPARMGYPAGAPPPVAPIVNALVPPVHPVQAQGFTSMPSAPLASTPARNLSAEPPLVGRHSMGEDYEAKPMSISSGSDISVKPEPPAPAVTVDDVKNTWLNYTGQKMTAAVVAEAKSIASNASSGKSQAFDYDGLDVVHVLRIMLGLEDELSFLAIQVQNYYQKAEKLEAEEKRKSFGMLSEADFVNLLKQCRDKFYAILKANVSPSDVMKKLNLAVFALNALLESSACEKLRPAAPPPAVVDLPKVSPKSPRPVARELSRDSSSLPPSRAMSNPIADALAHLPQNLLVEMSSIIATSLIAQGKDRLSDTELNSNLLNIFRPILRHTVESPAIIDPQPSAQGSFSGLKSGTAEPRLRKSGGSVTEDEGFGMTSFLPRGGGGSWGRDGRNPIPEDQEKSDIRSTQENRSPFVNEPGPSKISNKLGDLEAKSGELQNPRAQLHNRNDEEPYHPENEYRNPTLSYERRKSVELVPNAVGIIAPTPVDKVGPRLPAGIANLIQKEKTARTLGAAGVHSSTNLDFRRPDRSASLRVDRLVNATSSISSISEIGEVKEIKRYRRKSKKLKAEADNEHKTEHRKKRRRHSQISPERSTKRVRDERHPSRRHSDGMDRMPESRHAESHRKERHRGKEHRKRRSADGKEPEKSDEHQGSHSRRRRRSKTKKKHKRKESTDSKIDGVSKHFWNESGSTISSEDNIPDSQGGKDKGEDEIQLLGSHVPAYRASNTVEEGELICTSEEDFSDSPRSHEGNKDVALQSEDIVFEGDS